MNWRREVFIAVSIEVFKVLATQRFRARRGDFDMSPLDRTRLPEGRYPLMRRLLLGCLVLCVLLQGLALSAELALGRAHHHIDVPRMVAAAHALHDAQLRLQRRVSSLREVDTQANHDETQPGHHHHHHLELARHRHAPDDASVVYAQQDTSALSGGDLNALPRSVHDLDGLFFWLPLLHAAAAAGSWPVGAPHGFRSHVTLPLERPPRG
jgi:hypothetical protein